MSKFSRGEGSNQDSNISRRSFLQRLGAAALTGFLPTLSPASRMEAPHAEITRNFNEFSRLEILHFPNHFIDSVLRFLGENANQHTKFSQIIQLFSEREGQGLSAEKNRKILESYGENVGPLLEALLQRFEAVDPLNEQTWNLQALQKLYLPLLDLQQYLQYEDISAQGAALLVQRIQDFLEWNEPLALPISELERKTLYDERAQQRIQDSGLWNRVAEEWQRKRDNGQEVFSSENEHRFREIFDIYQEYYPRFLAEVDNMTFTTDTWSYESGRSFFRDYENTIGFVPHFFLTENSGPGGIEEDSKVVAHEVSHAYDPTGEAADAWVWADPREVLAYYEKYAELMEGFKEFVSGDALKNILPVSPQGIEYFSMSRWQDGIKFGIDQLLFSEDWEACKYEMQEMRRVLELITHTEEGRSITRARGLEYFFVEKEQPLLFWQIRSQQHVPDNVQIYNPFYCEWVSRQLEQQHKDLPATSDVLDRFPRLAQFTHITPELLDQLLELGESIFSQREEFRGKPEIQEILNLLLDFKSFCTFILATLRYRSAQYGGMRSSNSEVIQALYSSQTTKSVLSHFFHMMTGPLTQYTRVAGYQVLSRDENPRVLETLIRAERGVSNWRTQDQNAILSAFDTPVDLDARRRADAFNGFLNRQAHQVWLSREVLWGATGEYVFPHAVKQISLSLFPENPTSLDEYITFRDKGLG